MQKQLHCASCGAALTTPLALRFDGDRLRVLKNRQAGEALLPPGIAQKSMEALAQVYVEPAPSVDFAPQWWLNAADLTDAVTGSPDTGCCGMAGLDGPNQRCRCGAEIGTLQNDCYELHVFIPQPDATEWRWPDHPESTT